MYIIADSGSTKTEWCILDRNGGEKVFRTSGINPVHLCREKIADILNRELLCERRGIRKIFFYGAGCAFPEKNAFVEYALNDFFEVGEVEVASDLLAASRSLCKDKPGICCILGTGSNSCFYDGRKILHNVPPLGFILGDEGSGAVLGKKLLANVLKGLFSKELTDLFFDSYPYSYAEFIDKVYRQALPNRFLASLTEFMYKHMEYPEIRQLVGDTFDEFIRRNILQYKEARDYPVCFTGSTAFFFKESLEERLSAYHLHLGEVTRAPMQGLVDFHKRKMV